MRFTNLWWLLLLPVVWGAVVLISRLGNRTVPARQHRWAVAVRLVVVSLLVVALSGPLLVRPVDTNAVFFVVDRSASIPADARQAQDAYLNEALDQAASGSVSGVLVFGSESRVDAPLRADRASSAIATLVDSSATDLASALRAVGALLPSEGSRRVVVLTDSVVTVGDARLAARELAERDIAVDVVAVETGRGADVLVEGIDLPASAREGDTVTATIRMRSNVATTGELTVTGTTGETLRVPVDLQPGRNEVEVSIPADQSGVLVVEARVTADIDSRPENNTAEGLTRVLGPANVVVVEGRLGEAAQLAEAFEAGGVNVEVLTSIPDEGELLRYDALVLVNVPAPDDSTADAVASYVEDLGRGLVVVGGDQAFGMGGYGASPLESVLPVRSNPEDLVRRQPVAEVLVIDTSGSMGACHCDGGATSEGGVNKTDLSRAGASQAIGALEATDLVGVVAVSTGVDWVIPLAPKPSEAAANEALGSLFADGNTEIANGLQAALDELRGVDDALRHIVLFTDGWDPNENGLLPLAREIADAGITLSVLGTGEGPGSTLQRMAAVGGGRYYPGADLSSIPEIFVEETLTVSRNLTEEGVFTPILASRSEVTADLTASPPLYGYVLTKPKGTASTPLLIGQDDPLLATWQRGLGRATAWTSDATARWSTDWVSWDGYVSFWGAVLRDVLPATLDTPPDVRVDEGKLEIGFDAGEIPLDASAVARVRRPDGELSLVPLQRTGASTFSGTVDASSPGAYWVSVSVDGASGTLLSASSGAISSYEEEFAFREPDVTLAADLAEVTGGRVDPPAAEAFAPAPRVGGAETPIWPWLTALAMFLFLADVALRRLVFSAGDSQIWRAAVRHPTAPLPEVDPSTGEIKDASPVGPSPEAETVGHLLRRKNR